MSDRKTFVLVHGAWHGGWCWRRVANLLEARGHKVYAPTLTGVSDRAHLLDAKTDLTTHLTDIANLIKWEDLSGIVLCGHSYGGFVVSGVAEKAADRIASIGFLDAFLPTDGERMADLLSPKPRETLDALYIRFIDQLSDADIAAPLSYRNSSGQPFTKTTGLLLSHVFNHQTHHRGQITTLLSQMGLDIGVTDLAPLVPNIEI